MGFWNKWVPLGFESIIRGGVVPLDISLFDIEEEHRDVKNLLSDRCVGNSFLVHRANALFVALGSLHNFKMNYKDFNNIVIASTCSVGAHSRMPTSYSPMGESSSK